MLFNFSVFLELSFVPTLKALTRGTLVAKCVKTWLRCRSVLHGKKYA